MDTIIKKIESIEKLFHGKGCTQEQVIEAQSAINITFPKEYVEYVKKYGAISFFATEWTGLNIGGRINVVAATLQERELNPDFPKDCFVVENQGIDGIVAVADSRGKVYLIQYEKKELICESISEYLEQCIERRQ